MTWVITLIKSTKKVHEIIKFQKSSFHLSPSFR